MLMSHKSTKLYDQEKKSGKKFPSFPLVYLLFIFTQNLTTYRYWKTVPIDPVCLIRITHGPSIIQISMTKAAANNFWLYHMKQFRNSLWKISFFIQYSCLFSTKSGSLFVIWISIPLASYWNTFKTNCKSMIEKRFFNIGLLNISSASFFDFYSELVIWNQTNTIFYWNNSNWYNKKNRFSQADILY